MVFMFEEGIFFFMMLDVVFSKIKESFFIEVILMDYNDNFLVVNGDEFFF